MGTNAETSELANTYVKAGIMNMSVLGERGIPEEVVTGCLLVARHALEVAKTTTERHKLTPDTDLLAEVTDFVGRLSVIHNS